MIYYKAKNGLVYDGFEKYKLGIASPSLSMCAASLCGGKDRKWKTMEAFRSEVYDANVASSERFADCVRKMKTRKLINDLGGYQR